MKIAAAIGLILGLNVAEGHTTVSVSATASVPRVQRLARLGKSLEKIINSPEFKTKLLMSHYLGKPGFASTKKTPSEVFKMVLEASELRTKVDHRLDLKIIVLKGKRGVLGWTNPSTSKIWMNSRYFDNRQDSGLVGTMLHEASHKLGLGHDFKRTARRPYSAPYVLGTIAAQLYPKLK